MKKFCRALGMGMGMAIMPALSLFAADELTPSEQQLDLGDIQALRDWLNVKRQVTIKEIGGNLSLSAEVRFEFQDTNEVKDGVRQRGHHAATPLPARAYDVEVNLILDYRADNTWASIKIEFDNDGGLFTSTNNKLRIEKAYFGVRVYNGDLYVMDVELGRRFLGTCFDSKVQFVAQADSLFWKHDWSIDKYGDVYLHLMAMLVNDNDDRYAYISELGWLGIMDTGFFLKYSIADWDTKDYHSNGHIPRYKFIVNQWLFGYKWIPKGFGKLVMPYAALLWNPAAAKTKYTNHQKANWGGYFGVSLGELRKQWDWAFDANYQILQAQVTPGYDSGGIGLGNAAGVGLYTDKTDESGKPLADPKAACGKDNFRGFVVTLDWLLTNNLNFQQQWQQACTLDSHIGPWRRFKQYEIEFIYGF